MFSSVARLRTNKTESFNEISFYWVENRYSRNALYAIIVESAITGYEYSRTWLTDTLHLYYLNL